VGVDDKLHFHAPVDSWEDIDGANRYAPENVGAIQNRYYPDKFNDYASPKIETKCKED